jgi:phage baseplate assembly protein V
VNVFAALHQKLDHVIDELRRVRLRVDATVARAVIEYVNDSLKTQRLQLTILADEHEDDVEHMQPYGLSFVPPAGAECIALAPSGSRDGTVAICAQLPGDRPEGGKERTGGLYTAAAWRVFIDEDGHVHLGAETGQAKMARADRTDAEFSRLWDVLTGWTTVPNDGGAALKSFAATKVGSVQSTGADKVHGT